MGKLDESVQVKPWLQLLNQGFRQPAQRRRNFQRWAWHLAYWANFVALWLFRKQEATGLAGASATPASVSQGRKLGDAGT